MVFLNKTEKKRKTFCSGFTLVELIIVFAIVALLTVGILAILNPTMLVNKGYDARRKKDLARIRVAFEEYYSDKGCYPPQDKIDELEDKSNCSSTTVFAPYLKPWPCDPTGESYKFVIDSAGSCTKWFKAYTKLQNINDGDIPAGCKPFPETYHFEKYDCSQVNYGVASTNANWKNYILPGVCMPFTGCFNHTGNVESCVGPDCSLSPWYFEECKVNECP